MYMINNGYVALSESLLYYGSYIYYGTVSSIGVEVFVFLSGMGLYYSYSKNSEIIAFLSRRFKRILLPYIVVGLTYWYVLDVCVLKLDFLAVVEDFFFVSFINEGVRNNWFVLFILVMYLLFPLIYRLMYKTGHKNVMFAAILVCAVFGPVLLSTVNPSLYYNTEIALSRTAIFIVGCYMGELIKDGVKCSSILTGTVVITGIICGFMRAYFDFPPYIYRNLNLIYAISVMIIIVVVLHLIRDFDIGNRLFRFFGRYSFELYITHSAMRNVLNAYHIYMYELDNYCVMIAFSIIISIILNFINKTIISKLF